MENNKMGKKKIEEKSENTTKHKKSHRKSRLYKFSCVHWTGDDDNDKDAKKILWTRKMRKSSPLNTMKTESWKHKVLKITEMMKRRRRIYKKEKKIEKHINRNGNSSIFFLLFILLPFIYFFQAPFVVHCTVYVYV